MLGGNAPARLVLGVGVTDISSSTGTGGLSLPWCNIVKGRYKYTPDLLALESSQPALAQSSAGELRQPRQEAHLTRWRYYLDRHPDQEYAQFVWRGLVEGFRVGFDPALCTPRSAKHNLPSARDHPNLVAAYIQDERREGRLVGPLASQEQALVHTSPIGLIPKPHQVGKWRMITDLSSPRGSSVNDGVDPSRCSLRYASVDQAVEIVKSLGPGALVAKMDLKSAYRMVPVHPTDQPLLGISWEDEVFLDAALPFGLRSAPKVFSAVADALAWAMTLEGVSFQLHYLDDFFFAGPPDTSQCRGQLSVALSLCEGLCLPVAPSKTEGPSTRLTFLG